MASARSASSSGAPAGTPLSTSGSGPCGFGLGLGVGRALVARLDERAHVPELAVAIVAQRLARHDEQRREVAAQGIAQVARREVVVAVRAARRLGDDLV